MEAFLLEISNTIFSSESNAHVYSPVLVSQLLLFVNKSHHLHVPNGTALKNDSSQSCCQWLSGPCIEPQPKAAGACLIRHELHKSQEWQAR